MNNKSLNPKILASEAATMLNTSIQNIHKKIKSLGLETIKSQNRVYFSHDTSRKLFNFTWPNKIYSFQLVKGGVGKTAVSFMFAIRCCLLGAKVALIEIDQQANLTRSCKIDASNCPVMIDFLTKKLNIRDLMIPVIKGLDILPSRVENALLDNTLMVGKFPLDKVFSKPLNSLKEIYDIIIVDCPPSIGQAVTAVALASDSIVMPVNPTDYSLAGLDLTYNEITDVLEEYEKSCEIKILFNKFDARTTLSFHTLSDLIKHPIYGPKMVKSYIRNNQSIENLLIQGKSVFDTIRFTTEKEDFAIVTNEILELDNQLIDHAKS
jgi:chromosome partitioning protein